MNDDTVWDRRDILALVIIVLGISLFHLRGLRPGYTFLPVDLANNNLLWRSGPPGSLQNWLISDPLYEFYPFLANDVNTIRDTHSWPLWNPRIFLGHPVLADPINQPFYPFFVLLGLVFGAARALAIGPWSHAVLAAALTYSFLRTVQCRRHAAVLGALTYALSGYMVTWFEATHRISTLSWLPGVLWAFELAVRRRSLRYTALAALLLALATLGGQFQFIMTFGLFLSLYTVGRTIELARNGDRAYTWPLAVLAMTVSLGSLLCAVQVIPFAEFLNLSHRTLLQGRLFPLDPRQLITLIIPDFYGNPASIGPYWGASNYSEATIYAGLPALLLACLVPFCTRRFSAFYMFLVTVGTVYFIVGPGLQILSSIPVLEFASLRRSAFILPLLIAILAAMSLSEPRIPSKVAASLAFILAATTGLAVYMNWGQAQDHWQNIRGPIFRATMLLIVTIAILTLRDRLPKARQQANWGLVGLVFVDLFLFGSRFNPAGPVGELMPPTPAIDYLRAHAGLYRVVTYQLDEQVLVGPNVLSIYGISQGDGYSSLVSARYHQLVGADDPKTDITDGVSQWLKLNPNIVFFSHPSRRLLDLLGVAYVVSPVPLTDPSIRAEFVLDGCDGDTGEIAGKQTVTSSFVVRDTAINRLDLRFRILKPGQTSGIMVIRMWQGADRQRQMLDAHLDATELENQENVTLYFAPEREAPGRTYVWEVAAADAAPSTGVGLCTDAEGQPAISVYGTDWSEVYNGEVSIYERLAPLPRAYVVYAAEHIPDDAQAVSRLLDEAFDLRNVAVTSDSLNLPVVPAAHASPANIVTYEDTRVDISASADRPGLLILGDQFYPGWQAYLDGQPAAIQRVNYIMRGVILPPGDHQVVFRFEPLSLRVGGLLSMVGIIALIILAAFDRHPRIIVRLRPTAAGEGTEHS